MTIARGYCLECRIVESDKAIDNCRHCGYALLWQRRTPQDLNILYPWFVDWSTFQKEEKVRSVKRKIEHAKMLIAREVSDREQERRRKQKLSEIKKEKRRKQRPKYSSARVLLRKGKLPRSMGV